MSVTDLIAALQQMPPDMLVLWHDGSKSYPLAWVGNASMYEDDNVVVVLAARDLFDLGQDE